MRYKYTPEQRIVKFWNKIDQSGGEDACWNFQLRCRNGYGQIWWDGKMQSAHRIAFSLTNGEVGDKFVLHKCDNPSCCNPRHLFLGTQKDNMIDREIKGRHNAPRREENGRARLTGEQVDEIRRRYAEGGITHQELATQYNIGKTQIGRILRRVHWIE